MSDEPTVILRQAESQLDKFKQAAREIECDESEAHWDERLKKVVKHKPVPERKSDD